MDVPRSNLHGHMKMLLEAIFMDVTRSNLYGHMKMLPEAIFMDVTRSNFPDGTCAGCFPIDLALDVTGCYVKGGQR